jgi:putative aldouronate transport system substrate-binding protein
MKKIKTAAALFLLFVITACGPETKPDGVPTLTYWMQLNGNVRFQHNSMEETVLAKELERRTGVKINYMHPSAGDETVNLSILIAAGNLPDIIEHNWNNIAGGPASMIEDGVILGLDEIIEKYSPNYARVLGENPETDYSARTVNGNVYSYTFSRESDYLTVLGGPIIRQDWLSDLELPMPETMADWYAALLKFKNEKGALVPLSFAENDLYIGIFCGAYGTKSDFFIEDGKIKFGFAGERHRRFLYEMKKWYDEGLIAKNVYSSETEKELNIKTNKSGAFSGLAGYTLGRLNTDTQKKNPRFLLRPAPYPVLVRGDRPMFSQRTLKGGDGTGAAISVSCKNIEAAARFLDYGYGKDGMFLYNFGVEGESYVMKNAYPTYTDIIMNNPKGLSIPAAMGEYIRGNQLGPFVQANEYLEQYYSTDEQKEALRVWGNSDELMYMLPFLQFKVDESRELKQISDNIKKYSSDMTFRYILGLEDLEQYDAVYMKNILELKLGRAEEIYQQVYERYKRRPVK